MRRSISNKRDQTRRKEDSPTSQTKRAMLDFCECAQDGEELVLSVHDQLVAQVPVANLNAGRASLEVAMNGSFQEILKYEVRSEESTGYNFGEL